jgi:DNA-binding transcriptional LysR family regulator
VGSGCFIIPRHLSDLANDIRVIPISDSDAVISLHLIWKKSNTKDTLHLFINEFNTFFREQGEDLAEQAEATSL